MTGQIFRHAAARHIVQPGVAMRCHHDQVGLLLNCQLAQHRTRIAWPPGNGLDVHPVFNAASPQFVEMVDRIAFVMHIDLGSQLLQMRHARGPDYFQSRDDMHQHKIGCMGAGNPARDGQHAVRPCGPVNRNHDPAITALARRTGRNPAF